ncbi:YfdX family protein [Citrobacter tructae]|uniref:YfdX family protein n=1 Tax=Citrobacter tructae TaxID=2562449 RepID=A0ABX5TBZ6_9ENTR|nr:YfdX family protein [Citrobacter tructae]QBX82983.1 YfdX family protein [Citrobacter tructae]
MKKIILAGLLATMMSSTPVLAATTTTPAQAASANVQKEAADIMQVAVKGTNAMRDIQFARLALFHGQPDSAKKLTDDAASLLAGDSSDWAKFVKTDAKAKMIDDQYVIINATVAVSEDYIASPEKETAIKTANGKMAKGDWKGAVDTLQLAGISVAQTQYLMPLNQTRKAVASAEKLLSSGKYYEANLALKGAEEGIVIDSEVLGAGQ